MNEEKILKFFGQIGIFLLFLVAFYLLAKISGLVRSVSLEEILTAAVFGALFYVGYSYRAIEEIKELKESFQELEKRVAKLER